MTTETTNFAKSIALFGAPKQVKIGSDESVQTVLLERPKGAAISSKTEATPLTDNTFWKLECAQQTAGKTAEEFCELYNTNPAKGSGMKLDSVQSGLGKVWADIENFRKTQNWLNKIAACQAMQSTYTELQPFKNPKFADGRSAGSGDKIKVGELTPEELAAFFDVKLS